jgi:hypothetical protein
MITLNTPYVTTVQTAMNGQVQTDTTDTLLVSYVEVNFTSLAIGIIPAIKVRAKLQRGTVVAGVFVSNYPEVWVTVFSDGSFTSTDNPPYAGKAGSLNIGALLSGLASIFDGAVLSSGEVQGTAV